MQPPIDVQNIEDSDNSIERVSPPNISIPAENVFIILFWEHHVSCRIWL